MADLPLSLCAVAGDLVDPLLDGVLKAEGIELTVTRTDGSTLHWRQLKFHEFDVSVMSVTSFFISRANGTFDAVALPVFASRRFMHADLRCHAAAVWLRGVLDAATINRAFSPETNLIDRSTQNRGLEGDWSKIKPLFADKMKEGARFFSKYGCQDYLRTTRELLGPDPYPYGFHKNRKMLETVTGFCVEQGLLREPPRLEDYFAPSTLDA